MLPHHRTVHNDVPLPNTFINMTLARLKCKLPDDGRRAKHVGAVLISDLVVYKTHIKCICWQMKDLKVTYMISRNTDATRLGRA